ncbi:uncharacterized [Tachysurus ichikawai]
MPVRDCSKQALICRNYHEILLAPPAGLENPADHYTVSLTGQERQQSAPVILVMISLRRAIASHALFNKGTFEVLRSNPRLSFHMLPVYCKWNQNEVKEIKGKHLSFMSSPVFLSRENRQWN